MNEDLEQAKENKRRAMVRRLAIALAAATAVMYFLIGFDIANAVQNADVREFGFIAGAAYIVSVLLLLLFDWKPVYVIGAAFQVMAILIYFNVAGERVPMYELWGILIKITQAAILVALAYLIVRPRVHGRWHILRRA